MGLTVTPTVVDFLAGSVNSTSAPALLVCSQDAGRCILYPCLVFVKLTRSDEVVVGSADTDRASRNLPVSLVL